MGGGSTGGGVGVRTAVERAGAAVVEVRPVAGAHNAGASIVAPARAVVVAASAVQASRTRARSLVSDNGVVEDGAGATLPVIDKAFANLPDCTLDTFGGALHFDNSLGRLGEHFFLGDHADAGHILDMLDLETLPSDDSAHLVVRDEELDG